MSNQNQLLEKVEKGAYRAIPHFLYPSFYQIIVPKKRKRKLGFPPANIGVSSQPIPLHSMVIQSTIANARAPTAPSGIWLMKTLIVKM